jgi:hypothetical protein
VVAGDHLHPDARLLAFGHRLDGLLPGRVDDAAQGHHDEAVLLHVGERQPAPARLDLLRCQREQPLPARGDLLHPPLPALRIDRPVTFRGALPVAHRQHPLRCPLEVQQAVSVLVVMVQGDHELVGGLEGDHVVAGIELADLLRIESALERRDDQRALGGISLQHPFAVAVMDLGVVAQQDAPQGLGEHRVLVRAHVLPLQREAPVGRVADAAHLEFGIGGDDGLHRHLVAGERAGLVGADGGDRAQGLHRRQAADDGVARGHALHADGERDGHDGGQALGDGGHGEADGARNISMTS